MKPIRWTIIALSLFSGLAWSQVTWSRVFQLPTNASSELFGTFTVADVNGDGLQDVIAYAPSRGALVVFPGETGGIMATRTLKVLDPSVIAVTQLQTADIDGDGDVDIYGYSQATGSLWWWQNNGGTFQRFTIGTFLTSLSFGMDVLDDNSDGFQELAIYFEPVATGGLPGTFQILTHQSNQSLAWTAATISTVPASIGLRHFSTSDVWNARPGLSATSKKEIIASTSRSSMVIRKTAEPSTWVADISITASNSGGYVMSRCSPFKPQGSNLATIYCWEPSTSADEGWSATTIDSTAVVSKVFPQGKTAAGANGTGSSSKVFPLDANHDGIPEIIRQPFSGGQIFLHQKTSGMEWKTTGLTNSTGLVTAIADLQGNGSSDVLLLESGHIMVSRQLSEMEPFFGANYKRLVASGVDGYTGRAYALDANLDGASDLVIPNTSGYLKFFSWDAVQGNLVTGNTDILAKSTSLIASGDPLMTGYPALVVTAKSNGAGSPSWVGAFAYNIKNSTTPYNLANTGTCASGMVVQHAIDGSGITEMVSGKLYGTWSMATMISNVIYTCRALVPGQTGVYWYDSIPTGSTSSQLAKGDIDNDGSHELVVNTTTGFTWFGNTSGSWVSHPVTTTGTLTDLYLADLDGDGDADLLGYSGATLVAYENVNKGASWTYRGAVSASTSTQLSFADMDLDGHLDIVGATTGVVWWRNPGSWSFSQWSKIVVDSTFTAPEYALTGDFDFDGAMDIVAGKSGNNYLYLNRPNVYAPKFDAATVNLSLSEGLATGNLVHTMVATDQDSTVENRLLRYTFLDAGITKFTLDSISGGLTLATSLDREVASSLSLRVLVSDRSVPFEKKDTVTVAVQVTDVNDNRPVFPLALDTIDVPEGKAPGSLIDTIEYTDLDEATSAYSHFDVIGGTATSVFLVDPASGIINLAKSLDREFDSTYSLVIKVSNIAYPFGADTLQLTIRITDVNDNAPLFNTLTSSPMVLEGRSNVALLRCDSMVSDADRDSNAMVHFALYSSPASLAIDSTTGLLRVVTALDRETASSVQVHVRAYDLGLPSKSDTLSFALSILDSNEYAPHFAADTLSFAIAENTPTETSLATLTATDADADHSTLQYSLLSGSDGDFRLEADGRILVNDVLPRNQRPAKQYSMQMQVSDGLRKDSLWINIRILDVNDSIPRFVDTLTTLTLSENLASATLVASLSATDGDGLAYGTLSWKIMSGNVGSVFAIDSLTGALRISSSSPDFETWSQYRLLISAQDHGSPAYSAERVLRIFITDSNDVAPAFLVAKDTIAIDEHQAGAIPVGTWTASDPEEARNGLVRYSLLDTNDLFRLDTLTGALVFQGGPIHYEQSQEYSIGMVARDLGLPALTDTLAIHVKVNNLNDIPMALKTSLVRTVLADSLILPTLDSLFSDADGDSLVLSLQNPTDFLCAIEKKTTSWILHLNGASKCQALLVATDPSQGQASMLMNIQKSSSGVALVQAPLVLRSASVIDFGNSQDSVWIGDMDSYFLDPQGLSLAYQWVSPDKEFAQVVFDSSASVFRGIWSGVGGLDTLKVVASNGKLKSDTLYIPLRSQGFSLAALPGKPTPGLRWKNAGGTWFLQTPWAQRALRIQWLDVQGRQLGQQVVITDSQGSAKMSPPPGPWIPRLLGVPNG